MRVFKSRVFSRFAIQNSIADRQLCDAIRRAERGLIDADLGGGVIKQRIARQGEGRSGGFRSIILFRTEERAVFVHGFAKSNKANLNKTQTMDFKKLAKYMLALNKGQFDLAVKSAKLLEVKCNDENIY